MSPQIGRRIKCVFLSGIEKFAMTRNKDPFGNLKYSFVRYCTIIPESTVYLIVDSYCNFWCHVFRVCLPFFNKKSTVEQIDNFSNYLVWHRGIIYTESLHMALQFSICTRYFKSS